VTYESRSINESIFIYFAAISKYSTTAGLPRARSGISGPNFLVNFRTFLSVSRGSRHRKCTFSVLANLNQSSRSVLQS